MPHSQRVLALAALLAVPGAILAPAPRAHAQSDFLLPNVYAPADFIEAQRKAQQEGKIIVVIAVRDDCDECPRMEHEVFENPRIVQWLNDNAVCFRFDAKEEPGETLRFKPGPFPTFIVIRDGQEIDRMTEVLSANEFLDFVKQAQSGRTRAQRLTREYHQARPAIERDAQKRYDWAVRLLDAHAYDDATDEFVFLWNNIVDLNPTFDEFRRTLMAKQIKSLCFRHPPALQAFSAIRDALTPKVDPEIAEQIDPENLKDWIALNNILRKFDATVAWTQNVVDNHDPAILARGGHILFESLIFPSNAWRLAGLVYQDPMDFISYRAERWGKRLHTHPAIDSYHLDDYGKMYGALLAAGRIEDAVRVANAAIDFKDDAMTRDRLADKAELAGVDESLRRVWQTQGPLPPSE